MPTDHHVCLLAALPSCYDDKDTTVFLLHAGRQQLGCQPIRLLGIFVFIFPHSPIHQSVLPDTHLFTCCLRLNVSPKMQLVNAVKGACAHPRPLSHAAMMA